MTNTLKADIERFPETASQWEALSTDIGSARTTIAVGDGQGWRFGLMANGIDAAHDTFIASMLVALDEGGQRTSHVAALLHEVARDFGMTDAEQASYLKDHQFSMEG